jgi:hypothetical protein
VIEVDPDVAIAVLKETKRLLSERPRGFDDAAFRRWFREIGAMKFFGRPFPRYRQYGAQIRLALYVCVQKAAEIDRARADKQGRLRG